MEERKTIIQLARDLRKNQTASENLLWQNLRNRKLLGFKFNRQFPVVYGNDSNGTALFFIVDFYCHEKNLVIELDGEIHNFQHEYDRGREYTLTQFGLKIIRFKNEELNNITAVLDKIKEELTPNPSFKRGERLSKIIRGELKMSKKIIKIIYVVKKR